jgi:hypothetical protein
MAYRSRESYKSQDPEKRAAQLQNLKQGKKPKPIDAEPVKKIANSERLRLTQRKQDI